jgi:putative phage-type endonuclease
MIKIYATDIASILGFNPNETAWMLLEKKIENKYKFVGNKYTEHGNKYENSALLKFQKENGITVTKNNEVLKYHKYDWLTGIVDGITENDNKIIEIKCPYRKKRDLVDIFSVPMHYWIQCQVYMNLLNINTTVYIEYYVKPGSPTNGESGSISTIDIQRDVKWWNENEQKIINFYNELKKWSEIGSLKTHPIRMLENQWSQNFNSDC